MCCNELAQILTDALFLCYDLAFKNWLRSDNVFLLINIKKATINRKVRLDEKSKCLISV